MGRGLASLQSDEESPSSVWQGLESSSTQPLHPAIRQVQALVRCRPWAFSFPG